MRFAYLLSVAALVALLTVMFDPHPPHVARLTAAQPTPAGDGHHFTLTPLEDLDRMLKTNQARWFAEVTRQERARAALRRTVTRAVTVTGPCAAMKPAGFSDAVIWRESRGNPEALNPSGAYGCAQLLRSKWSPGGTCYGLDYAACWSKVWAGGAGACHWEPPNYCAGR